MGLVTQLTFRRVFRTRFGVQIPRGDVFVACRAQTVQPDFGSTRAVRRPYSQGFTLALDVRAKRLLAKRFGLAYAATMDADPALVTVSVHDLGEGSVWRCTADEPRPHTLIMCDVRRGRTAETRAALARHLIEICADVLSPDPGGVKVEFTQHSGDEMFHPHLGGFNSDWTARDPEAFTSE